MKDPIVLTKSPNNNIENDLLMKRLLNIVTNFHLLNVPLVLFRVLSRVNIFFSLLHSSEQMGRRKKVSGEMYRVTRNL